MLTEPEVMASFVVKKWMGLEGSEGSLDVVCLPRNQAVQILGPGHSSGANTGTRTQFRHLEVQDKFCTKLTFLWRSVKCDTQTHGTLCFVFCSFFIVTQEQSLTNLLFIIYKCHVSPDDKE